MTKQMLLLLEAHIHHAWKKASKILYVTNLDAIFVTFDMDNTDTTMENCKYVPLLLVQC